MKIATIHVTKLKDYGPALLAAGFLVIAVPASSLLQDCKRAHSCCKESGETVKLKDIYQWKLIKGCDARGDGDSVYVIRRTLLGFINLHTFLRSDGDEHHDHPWHFVSIILWRGYLEETGIVTRPCANPGCIPSHPPEVSRKRVYPGMVLFRRASHRHRVVLVDGKKAITLMIRGPRVREWGFFTAKGWQHWVRYFKEKGC
jgi:hypothetical protein